MADAHTILNNREKTLCEYGGVIGALFSLTCLFQHLIFAIPNHITYPMIPAYLLAVTAFVLLAMQKSIAAVLLIISAVLSAVIEYIYIKNYTFSLVVVLLFLYEVIAVVALFTEDIPKKLKMKRAAEKAEQDTWAGKI
jgi:predicted ferric reductase